MKNMKRDRDRSIDQLLRAALEAPASDGSACLDAETAAAFADDALGRVERSSAVAHAARCSRCQALLGAIVKTSPPEATAAWWRMRSAGWLAPLSAAAAGVIVWAILPQLMKPRPAVPAPGASRLESARSVSGPPSPSAEQRLGAAPEKRASRQPSAASTSSTAATAAPLPAPRTSQAANLERQAAAIDSKATVPTALIREDAAGGTAASTPAPSAPAAAATLATPGPATPAAGVSAPAVFRSQTAVRRNGLALSESVVKVAPLIVSPDATSRWRIVPGGGVQHSSDAGSTWERQETGVMVTLTSGASTSRSICWLVGGVGTVLRSTDGRTWRRVAFPETIDLVSIRATDERSATVTTSDGRRFLTKDGGVTWVRVPGA